VARSLVEIAKDFLRGRAGAYRRVFAPADQDAQLVLRDLAKFCRAHESTACSDARLDGRREVWLRLQHHLNLDTETLWKIYGGNPIKGE
jgi:hypothetical protein